MSTPQFNREFLGSFEPQIDPALLKLAEEYHERTEAFDRTACTGPIRNGSIMPSNGFELRAVNRNAHEVRKDIQKRASRIGFSPMHLYPAIRYASRMGRT